MVIERGEIWWAELGEPSGSGPGFRRPVVVVQSDAFNRSKIQTVIAIAITSNGRLAAAPGNVLLARSHSGLTKDSVANVSQLVTLDRGDLVERVHRLPAAVMSDIDRGLKLVLDV